MAKTPYTDLDTTQANGGENADVINAFGQDNIDLPSSDFIADADILRDGQDLVLRGPDGETVVIEDYFSVDPAPVLSSPDGNVLTPKLVDSFVRHDGPLQYADAGGQTDVSPVGMVHELSGQASVTRADGSTETLTLGMNIFEGDIIETGSDGAVNIMFSDESSFAVSEDAKLAIDEYVYDPVEQSGTSDFSILRGVFVFTSGLIGLDDPDAVEIETPVGSIGIRGTTIAGKIDPSGGDTQITVVEGAIVVRNGEGEMTLSDQYETVKLNSYNSAMQNVGQLDSGAMANDYGSLKGVTPDFFVGLDTGGSEKGTGETGAVAEGESGGEDVKGAEDGQPAPEGEPAPAEAGPSEGEAPADGEPQEVKPEEGPDGQEEPVETLEGDPDQPVAEDGEPMDGPEEMLESKEGEPVDGAREPTPGEDMPSNEPEMKEGERTPEGNREMQDGERGEGSKEGVPGDRMATDGEQTPANEPMMMEMGLDGYGPDGPDHGDPYGTSGDDGGLDAIRDTIADHGDHTDPYGNNDPAANDPGTDPAADDTTTNADTAPPPPPLELVLNLSPHLDEGSSAGEIVATVNTTVGFSDANFQLFNVPTNGNGHPLFLIQDNGTSAVIKLTNAGANMIDDINADLVYNMTVKVTLPDGRTDQTNFGLHIEDDGMAGGGGGGAMAGLELSTLGAADGFTITDDIGEGFGESAAIINDIDGDGINDLAITKRDNDAGDGRIFIVKSGSLTGGNLPDLTPGDVALTNNINFLSNADALSVASVGDFDGDGVVDFVLGSATSDDGSANSTGQAMIVSGDDENDLIQLYNLDSSAKVGEAVAGVGDVDGDGFADVIIGAPFASDATATGDGDGQVYFIAGGNGSLTGTGNVDPNGGTVLTDGNSFTLFGSELDAAGDYNNDGFADFIVSAPGIGSMGEAYLIMGGLGGPTMGSTIHITNVQMDATDKDVPVLGMGDVNGDGVSDVGIVATGENALYILFGGAFTPGATVDLSTTLSPSEGVRIHNTGAGTIDGGGAVGDFNGDGISDGVLIVRDGTHADVFVMYGGDHLDGTNDVDVADLLTDPSKAFHMTWDLSTMGVGAADEFEFEVASAGDLNGDGFDDLFIGTPDADSEDGAVTIVYGRDDTGNVVQGSATANNQSVVGTDGDDFIGTGGFNDISFNTGAGDDVILASANGLRQLDGGAGVDTHVFTGTLGTLDFSALGSESVSNIEMFKFSNDHQTLTLGLDDVFSLMEQSDEVIASLGNRKVLKIFEDTGVANSTFQIEDNGVTGHTLDIDSAGTGADITHNADGTTYNVYYHGDGYALLVDQNVDTAAVI